MTDRPGDVMPMEGHGAYNRSSRVQAAGLEPALSLFADAARAVPLPPGREPIVLADYGCSEGRNSILPMAAAVSILRARAGPSRPISIYCCDVPENDFSALFQTLDTDPESCAAADSQVFAYAVGRSYFEPLFSADTVNFGLEFMGGPVAEPRPGANSRPGANRLQPGLCGPGGVRGAGGRRLAGLSEPTRNGAEAWRPARHLDHGRRR